MEKSAGNNVLSGSSSNAIFLPMDSRKGLWFHSDKVMVSVTSSLDKRIARSLVVPLGTSDEESIFSDATGSFHSSIPSHLFFRYEDMIIHASRQSMARLIHSLVTDPSSPALVCTNVNIRLDFERLYLSDGSRRIRDTPNAGGSSLLSEVLSLEFLERFLGLKLSKTEMEVAYWPQGGPMTDYVAHLPQELGDSAIGVSVTRAMAYHRAYTKQDATRLLSKKLSGVIFSNQNIVNERIDRQILHIWTPSGKVANVVKRTWARMPRDLLGNTIVVISTVNSKWMFGNTKAQRGYF